jgi:hypothetical protein
VLPNPSAGLSRALQEQDQQAAAVAFSSLLGQGVEAAAAELRIEASRRRADPHGAIYAAQATRALSWIGDRYAEPVLRSVARYLARSGPPARDRPEPLRLNEADTTSPHEIAAALLATPLISLDGLSGQSIWQALCLIAVDTRLSEGYTTNLTGGRGLHQTTLLDALWFIYDHAPPVDRPSILTDAVSWLLSLRSQPAVPLERHDAFARALARLQNDSTRFVEGLRSEVAQKGSGEHDFKFFAAVAEVAAKLTAPVRERFWAAAALAHPIGSADKWERADEASSLIARFLPT